MNITEKDVDEYLQSVGAVTWGKGFDISKPDTRALAVKWFMRTLENIEKSREINVNQKVELFTPTGGMRMQVPVGELHFEEFDGFLQFILVPTFGISVVPTDSTLVSKSEVLWALKLNPSLEVKLWRA